MVVSSQQGGKKVRCLHVTRGHFIHPRHHQLLRHVAKEYATRKGEYDEAKQRQEAANARWRKRREVPGQRRTRSQGMSDQEKEDMELLAEFMEVQGTFSDLLTLAFFESDTFLVAGDPTGKRAHHLPFTKRRMEAMMCK